MNTISVTPNITQPAIENPTVINTGASVAIAILTIVAATKMIKNTLLQFG